MSRAERVAKALRENADDDTWWLAQGACADALADLVEAGERLSEWSDEETYSQMLWRDALTALAKALGVEGE